MSTTTARLGLVSPVTADGFSTTTHAANLALLDAYPGIYPCTSGSRPAGWGAAHTGMHIFETDSGLIWRWNGTIFVRAQPVGILGQSDITADFPTSSTAAVAAITCTVTIPAFTVGSTTKRIRISASWYSLDNGTSTTLGAGEVSLYRASTALKTQAFRGRPNTATSPLDWGVGGSIEAYDAPTAGSTQYTLRINSLASVGGTSTLRAGAPSPAHLTVAEVGV